MNVFINLAVADLPRSRAFFGALGFAFDDRFADDTACAMTISDKAAVMLLTRERFSSFTNREVADAAKTSEALIAIQLDSRETVDQMIEAVLAAGGTEPMPTQDHGFMYGRSFADLDGHIWEPFWMDAAAIPAS